MLAPPQIAAMTPLAGPPGTQVTITGAAFTKRTQPMYEEFYRGAGNTGRDMVKYVSGLK